MSDENKIASDDCGIVLKYLIDFCNSQTPEKVPLYNPYDNEEEILVYELDSFQKIN